MATKRRRSRRRHAVANRKHVRRHRRKSNPFGYAMRRHHRRHRNAAYTNRRRHHHRRARRNPAELGGAVTLRRVPKAIPLVLTGAVSAIAVSAAPALPLLSSVSSMIGPSFGPMAAQVVVAVGGAMVLPMVGLRGAYPMTWLVVGLAIPVAQWIKTNILAGLGIPGLSAYPRTGGHLPMGFGTYPPNVRMPIGAYPHIPGMHAFPQPGGFQPAGYNYAGAYSGRVTPGLPVFNR